MSKFETIVPILLFLVGCFGTIVHRRSIVKFIISIELIFLSAVFVFALVAKYTFNEKFCFFSILLMTVSVVDVAIFLFITSNDKNE